MKVLRWALIILGVMVGFVVLSWAYTSFQLSKARSKGIYPSAEQAMLTMIDQNYTGISSTKILYAGTNSFDGSKPHVWYVIAEVRAAQRANGSEMGKNGCDAPGSFFLQTKDGWVHMPEGAFPGFIGFWMNVFDWAGPGQSTPSTNWGADQPSQFCLDE